MCLSCNLLNVYMKPCKCLLNVYANMVANNKMHMDLNHDNSIVGSRPKASDDSSLVLS